MAKIKMIKNKNVIGIDFRADLLQNGLLVDICKLFKLGNIYIDIFGADNDKLIVKLMERNFPFKIFRIGKLNSLAIKATVDDIITLTEILEKNNFDELNIWNCYTTWGQYLKDKDNYQISKSVRIQMQEGFFLNFNRIEWNKVEIICDLFYDKLDLELEINELIK